MPGTDLEQTPITTATNMGRWEYDANRLTVDPDITFDEWAGLMASTTRMAESVQWWLGDVYLFGEAKFGEEASQALDASGVAFKTIQNYAWVAKAIPAYARVDGVSWSVHAELASLPESERDLLLAKAAENAWTVNETRRELNPPQDRQQAELDADDNDMIDDAIIVETDGADYRPVFDTPMLAVDTYRRRLAETSPADVVKACRSLDDIEEMRVAGGRIRKYADELIGEALRERRRFT